MNLEEILLSVARIDLIEVSSGNPAGSSPYSVTIGDEHTLNINVSSFTNGSYSIILEGQSAAGWETVDSGLLIKQ